MPRSHESFNLFIKDVFSPYLYDADHPNGIMLFVLEDILSEKDKLQFKANPEPLREKIFHASLNIMQQFSERVGLADDSKQTLLNNWEKNFAQLFSSLKPESKSTIELDQLEQKLEAFAYKKDLHASHVTHTPIHALTHKISRAVMRNPSLIVLQQLHHLHQIIKSEFIAMPDASIEWLLGGAPAARGGFKNAQSFKEFFNANLDTISPSRLITALDTITTAISYRTINANWATPPVKPAVTQHAEHLMHVKINNQFSGIFIPAIGSAYTARGLDDIHNTNLMPDNIEEIFPDDISEASEVAYEEEKKPTQRSPTRFFKKKPAPDQSEFSWPAGAREGNIPIRAHVSGTAPLVLAVIGRLFQIGQSSWFNSDDHVRSLAGALLHPTYERGDFHTIPETAAGIEYYLEARRGPTLSTLTPQEAFQQGLQQMTSATEGDLHDLLVKMYPLILSKTQDFSVVSKPRFDDYLYILKTRKDYLDISQRIEFNDCIRIMLTEVTFRKYDITAKIQMLSRLLHTLKESPFSSEQQAYGMFKSTERTSLFRFTVDRIKLTLLMELDQVPVGLLSKEDLLAAKEILGTYKTNGPHAVKATSLSDPRFKKHELEQHKQDKIIAKGGYRPRT